jgi:hypothetical protein
MLVFYFLIFLFVYIANFLVPLIIDKMKFEKNLFFAAKKNLLTKVTCLDGNLFIISRNLKGVFISYYHKNGEPIKCKETDKLSGNAELKECGLNGELNNFDHICYKALSNLIYLVE